MISKRTTVAIIGAGPAGVAAAIQLKRNDIDFLLFEKHKIGGLLLNANLIENYLGFPNGITGKKFVALMQKQLKTLDIEVIFNEINEVEYINNNFHLYANDCHYISDFLIIASGTKAIQDTNIAIEEKAKDKIFFEIADAPLDKMNKAAVIGSGDAAFDYALQLASHNIKSVIFIRGRKSKALPILNRRAEKNKNISIKTGRKLVSINNNVKLNLTFQNIDSKEVVFVDYVFFAIGREPELTYAKNTFKAAINNLTKQKKLFMIGDVKNKISRQSSISTGEGIRAAMKIINLLKDGN